MPGERGGIDHILTICFRRGHRRSLGERETALGPDLGQRGDYSRAGGRIVATDPRYSAGEGTHCLRKPLASRRPTFSSFWPVWRFTGAILMSTGGVAS